MTRTLSPLTLAISLALVAPPPSRRSPPPPTPALWIP